MKAFLTIILVLTFGVAAFANIEIKDEIFDIEMGVVLVDSINDTETLSQMEFSIENSVARLYKLQNARITKALEFVTKKWSANLV